MSGPVLKHLITELGERSNYDAASQCTRCGFCETSCPTYAATGKETYSPRGRNQIVRLLLEGKFEAPASAEEALSTCLLCSACTTVCPAHVPTADLVLEGRRMLRAGKVPWLVRKLTDWLLNDRPALERALRFGYRLKSWGLDRLAARFGLLKLLRLEGLATASQHLSSVPERFLQEDLAADRSLGDPDSAKWAYFAPCGPNYVLPHVGRATIRALKALVGPGYDLKNGCCGLLSYNYGDLEAARRHAREIISKYETAGLQGSTIIVGDCSSCVSFLKSYPQLFIGDDDWKKRAERFVSRVRDAIEALPPENIRGIATKQACTYHDACRALNGQGISAPPRRIMNSAAKGAYQELPEADSCCGGAGAFAFTQPELSDELLQRKIANIAGTGARVVAASSTSCLLQLAHGLQKYYPECKAVHLTELVDRTLPSHGSQTRT